MKGINRRISLVVAMVVATTALGGSVGVASSADATKVSRPRDATVTIYLTRHGQTILNVVERAQGWTDSPLVDDTARAVPVKVGRNIAAREGRFDAAYSADMKRHYETATLILRGAHEPRLPVIQEEGLRELAFGKYEGALAKESWLAILHELGYSVDETAVPTAPADADGQNGGWQTMETIAMAQKGVDGTMAALKRVSSSPTDNGAVLPAEDCTDANARMAKSLDRIAKSAARNHDRRVLVVSSGLSISCYLTLSQHTPTTGISNVGVSKIQYKRGSWKVLSVNDKSYQQ